MDNPRRRRLLVSDDVGNDNGCCINWIVGPHDDGVMIDTTVRMLPTGRRGMLLFMATARVVARALRLVVLVAEAPRWLWYHHHHAMLMLMLIHVWHGMHGDAWSHGSCVGVVADRRRTDEFCTF